MLYLTNLKRLKRKQLEYLMNIQINLKTQKTTNQKLSGLKALGLDINLKEERIKEELQALILTS